MFMSEAEQVFKFFYRPELVSIHYQSWMYGRGRRLYNISDKKRLRPSSAESIILQGLNQSSFHRFKLYDAIYLQWRPKSNMHLPWSIITAIIVASISCRSLSHNASISAGPLHSRVADRVSRVGPICIRVPNVRGLASTLNFYGGHLLVMQTTEFSLDNYSVWTKTAHQSLALTQRRKIYYVCTRQ